MYDPNSWLGGFNFLGWRISLGRHDGRDYYHGVPWPVRLNPLRLYVTFVNLRCWPHKVYRVNRNGWAWIKIQNGIFRTKQGWKKARAALENHHAD